LIIAAPMAGAATIRARHIARIEPQWRVLENPMVHIVDLIRWDSTAVAWLGERL
jgi:hypothetical protein